MSKEKRPCPKCGGHLIAVGTHDLDGKLIKWRIKGCAKCGYVPDGEVPADGN